MVTNYSKLADKRLNQLFGHRHRSTGAKQLLG